MNTKVGSALVIGAGISGIRSALDLAEMHYRVYLIDKAPHLGGVLSQLDHQFPNDHCGMCKMLPTTNRDASSQFCLRKGLFHDNIEIMLSTELVALEGEPGRFRATLLSAPSFIDAEKCIGCGECARVCPVEMPDEFNAGLTIRKAVYLPVPHNIPNRYVIDTMGCTRCGVCQRTCPTGAIDLRIDARRDFRVLVVDDELVVRDSLKEWLEVEGFSVDMAGSGREAVELISQNEYGLMLLDIKMPGMDGVEVLRLAREMRESLPVLMMTAYATVETAVGAMKLGARDYLMKPFDIEALIAKVVQQYESTVKVAERQVEVGAVILASGCAFADPSAGANTYEYKIFPNVVTSVQFERLLSGTGPNGGRLLRPSDGKPAEKVAWLQCIGSRNLQEKADYCSSVCCMFSVKEALLAKTSTGGKLDTAIFYMDMRTFGKDFQRYRDSAESDSGVRFVRSRVHSVEPEPDGSLRLRWMDFDGRAREEAFDIVVLAAGQKPPESMEALVGATGIELNPWGFCRVESFFPGRTGREGVFAGGSFSGLKDISESVIQAGAASMEASRLIHSRGGSLYTPERASSAHRDVSREAPQVALALCTCGSSLDGLLDFNAIEEALSGAGPVSGLHRIDHLCTQAGWESLKASLKNDPSNRVLVGACMPCAYSRKLAELGNAIGLPPSLLDVVDIRTPAFPGKHADPGRTTKEVLTILEMAIARLTGAEPALTSSRPITPEALVVGGGIAGMTAALQIADHGFHVHLVERSEALGGLVRRLHRTLDGTSPEDLLGETVTRVESHPNISVHTKAEVIHSQGRVGDFLTTIEVENGPAKTLEHGVAILATGAGEAAAREYCFGQSESIVTLLDLERRLQSGEIDPAKLETVAMIQCVGSREGDRNYCSRVCCSSALKHALYLRERNPDLNICIFYRDMMTYGFLETHYTRARREGIIFIQYRPDRKPDVAMEENRIRITARDPALGRDITLNPDLLVLSTGMVPGDRSADLAGLFGVEANRDGFLKEADYKWQPVSTGKQGVFVCGTAHSPRSISESVAMAQAAAQRSLGILSGGEIRAGGVVAQVRRSLCSLCERCIAACPYGARHREEDGEAVEVDEAACQGCGSCAAVCPNGASVLRGYSDRQVLAMLDAALR